MGICRFILSIAVALSHMRLNILGYNQGVISVIIFLLISGYTMTVLTDRYYSEPRYIPCFYADRILRVWPQIIVYTILTLLWVSFAPLDEDLRSPYLENITLYGILLQLFLLPLGYYMFFSFLNGFMIPQAWTIGLELSFYLVFPFIYFKKIRTTGIILSFLFFLIAYCGKINPDIYGYRLLPGTLFIFLTGSLIAKSELRYERAVIAGVWLAAVCLKVLMYKYIQFDLAYTQEILIGLIIGIPLLIFLKHIKRSRIDIFLGDLSYGVYLSHYFAIYLFRKMPETFLERTECIIMSILLACLSYKFVEIPARKFRKKCRVRLREAADRK